MVHVKDMHQRCLQRLLLHMSMSNARVCVCHLFFDGCVDIGEVALTHHTERPHLLPQGNHVVLIFYRKDRFNLLKLLFQVLFSAE